MHPGHQFLSGIGMSLLLGLAACDGSDPGPAAGQTKFPGQISAGGGTSGEVMARAGAMSNTPDPSGTPGIPQGSGGNTGGAAMGGTTGGAANQGGAQNERAAPSSAAEGVRGQAPQGAASGTPGIPEGAGGNPSGAAMGGTTGGAAASQTAPPQTRGQPQGLPAGRENEADATGTSSISKGASGNASGAATNDNIGGSATTGPKTVAPPPGGPVTPDKQ
jgi:hypothetical protein